MTTITISASGATGNTLQEIQAEIIAGATALSPGLTANLPGTLIEDISSTDTAAVFLCQQAQIETIASVSPYAANEYILTQLGNIYGVQQGVGSNTSVYVAFSGTPGYVIPQGVTVSDGTYSYITQDATVIDSGGTSATVYCVATVSGTWAVPANSVTTITSSVPSGVTLTVTNPSPGIPSTAAQSSEDFRAQVLQAGLVSCIGMIPSIKAALQNVAGVSQNLVSVRQSSYYTPPRWEIIVGGGDPDAVANAIFQSCGDPGVLCGSIMQIDSVTTGSTTTITTNLVTGFTAGESITIAGATGITGINGTWTVTPVSGDPFSFTIPYSSSGTYTGGGVVTVGTTGTIPRNNVVTVYNTPDSYDIPYVIPVQQSTEIQFTWNTSSLSIITNATISALAAAPIQAYVNSLGPGQPINNYEIQYIFQEAVLSVLPTNLITHMVVQITLNGVITAPEPATNIVVGDPEGYYYAGLADITFVQG